MIITFCGHSTFKKNEEFKKRIITILTQKIAEAKADIYLGGYGNFDDLAYDCAKEYQLTHPNINLIFITPYITVAEYKKDHFDLIVYPELEKIPLRYAILHRNKWMVDQASIVIAYVTHKYGGAYTMYRYAKRKNKEIYNIALQCSN